jgi:thiol:disulfide interchange protein
MRSIAFLILLVALPLQAATTKARLILPSDAIAPGQTILAGVHLKMAPGWHTYWRNAGDAGAPTEIEWSLPAGVTAGEIQWPIPEKTPFGELLTYGYHDNVVLLVPLTVASTAAPGVADLKAEVSWLECEVQCVKGDAEVAAKLTIGPGGKPTADAALIDSWKGKLPKPASDIPSTAQWVDGPAAEKRGVTIEWTPRNASATFDFYPYSAKTFAVAAATEVVSKDGGKVRLKKAVEKFEGDWPPHLDGLLVEKAGTKSVEAYEVRIPIGTGGMPTVAGAKSESFWAMLGFAFLGGLILNIMPCVLPVIALKILGFVQQSKEAPGRVRALGIVYMLGVLASFLVMAGLVIAVQKAGRAASWGMQFQNPIFVVVMTTLVTLVALNLFGLFEINLGGRAMGAAGDLASKEGASGAFFNGVLATVLATPCTAPFLAVALGFAFAQPPQIIVLMFLVMGLGLAAPYLILSWFPQWLRVLPKPGAWMEKFKVAMGFPMLATALWLLSLTNSHFGSSGPLWVGLFLVVVALAAWVWGQFVQRAVGTALRRRPLSIAFSLALIASAYAFALERELDWRHPAPVASSGVKQKKGGIPWEAWSNEAVAQARASGRVVLVDFTADWCVTCQANKKSSLEIPSVRQRLKELDAVALLGDYTLEDPRIAEELKRYQRAGVPLVLVYPRDPKAEPIVLPALLTPGIVLDALDKAAGQQTVSRK